jgi:hypothetical protein
MLIHRLVPAVLCAAAVAACSQYLDPRLYRQIRPDLPAETAADVLQVRALGVQGFVVRHGADAVLFPPLYSNPPLERVVAGNVRLVPSPREVDAHLRPEWVQDVAAVLVGHSHYDHLMDVPYIAKTYATSATIYGSRTAAYLLGSFGLEDRVVPLNGWKDGDPDFVDYRSCKAKPAEGCVFAPDNPGDWVSPRGHPRMRIRTLCSRHSSQFAKLPVRPRGCLSTNPERPETSNDWRLGDTFAYLIEFLGDRGEVAFRVYFQDSPTDPEYGYIPPELLPADPSRTQGVDLAILCAGAYDQVRDNPRGIVRNVAPRFVLFGHWENFFRSPSKPLQTLFAFDFGELRDRMDALKTAAPPWGGEYWFAPPGTLYVIPSSP